MDVTFIQTSNSFCRKTLGSITILLALCVLESQVDAQELISGEKSLTDHHLLLHHRRTRKNAFEKLDQPLRIIVENFDIAYWRSTPCRSPRLHLTSAGAEDSMQMDSATMMHHTIASASCTFGTNV